MEKENLIEELKKKSGIEIYISQAIKEPSIIPMLFEIIETDKTALKFTCEKIIRAVSEEKPALIYPFFERMAAFLNSGNSFIKWGFLLSIPNILKADKENKWAKISGRYLSFFESAEIVPFGNVVSAVPKIIMQYPDEAKKIIPKLLNIDNHVFLYKGEKSPECRNVAKGHIIDCFDKLFPASEYQKEMITFAAVNIDNSRNQVRIKAKKFLKKYGMDQENGEKT